MGVRRPRVEGDKTLRRVPCGRRFVRFDEAMDALRSVEGRALQSRAHHTPVERGPNPEDQTAATGVLGRAGEAGGTAARVACSEYA